MPHNFSPKENNKSTGLKKKKKKPFWNFESIKGFLYEFVAENFKIWESTAITSRLLGPIE